ncbi:hypothetical protein M407DRAFT_29844 [Tulasnella calospora MUT 4182]|uniref:Uncharacterized protein n=1 Tax=Tulasnella calospora MUT 4182 TaxID=1051891 RepID=A0A0C3Q9D1_9AGAM|nr:hypothetical protein M407DRAFT_29844 [Tulasnella calospora MUT 4182]
MDEVAEIGYPLALTNTLQSPPTYLVLKDPFQCPLKRTDSAEACFAKFYPFLLWLRDFIQSNDWVTSDITDEFLRLWEGYHADEEKFGKIGAVQEFFSQKAHSKVRRLWDVYMRLRKQLEDMGTKRVTKRASEKQHRLAAGILLEGEWNL